MQIKPFIRNNVYANAHPLGCATYVDELFTEAEQLENFDGPKRVLIIGGSSGYGLSTRVTLAQNAGASTLNVSFEQRPSDKRSGTAGFWNNVAFLKRAQTLNSKHLDLLGNAFGDAMKVKAIETIKAEFGTVDLVVYSLAAGARPNPETGTLVYSSLKPIGQDLVGKTIDVATQTLKDIHIPAATQEDIDNTVYVMGGNDWQAWMEALDTAGCLAPGAKTISYTYVGSGLMDKIYRSGTIGQAKNDLERCARAIDQWLKPKYQGEALISSSKAVPTKASVFIPGITIYMACLFDEMKAQGTHETTLAHKHRLYHDMIYGPNRLVDEQGRVRIDHHEMDAKTQERTIAATLAHQHEGVFNLPGTQLFLSDFHHIHGFGYDHIDYDDDVDVFALIPANLSMLDVEEPES
jgi:enoyl-[acyl-carrier protein] reductase/trans-2-enoyl-CoA reductase (NAD+)